MMGKFKFHNLNDYITVILMLIILSFFILFNIFLISLTLESKLGNNPGYCPCFGAIYIQPFLHVLIIILSAIGSMWLFVNIKNKTSANKNFFVNTIIYIFIAILLSKPIFTQNNEIFGNKNESDAINWIKESCVSTSFNNNYNFNVLAFINLADLNCANCMRNIDQFIQIVTQDTVLKKSTLLIIFHPDQLNGLIRAKGWQKAQKLRLKFCYVPFEKVKSLGIRHSCVILFNETGKIIEKIVLPYPMEKLVKKFSQLMGKLDNE